MDSKQPIVSFLSNSIRFLNSTNIFISLAAVSLALATQVQLGMKPEVHPYLFIIFYATLLEYNSQRLIAIVRNSGNSRGSTYPWARQYRWLLFAVFLLSIVLFIGAILLAKREILMVLAPVALITFLYSLPGLSGQTNIFRLRELPFLKIFLVAAIWSIVTVLFPVIYSGNIRFSLMWMMLAERFLFIFAIAIHFDIRDMKVDSMTKLKTIPLFLGEINALALAKVSLLLFFGISVFHVLYRDIVFVLPALIASVILVVSVINKKETMASARYYGLLDGTMLIQGLLICLCYYLNSLIA